MKNEKSKVLKLTKKKNRLEKIKNSVEKWSQLAILVAFAGCIFFKINPTFAIIFISSAMMCGCFNYMMEDYIEYRLQKKIEKVEGEIQELTKEDDLEKQILKEYNSIIDLKDKTKQEITAKKILIRHMIETKNNEAKTQKETTKVKFNKNLVKDVIDKIPEEVKINEPIQKEEKSDEISVSRSGYSRTKAMKVYAEKTKEEADMIRDNLTECLK